MTRSSRTARSLLVAVIAMVASGCSSTPDGAVAKVEASFTGTSEMSFRLRRLIEDMLIDFERAPQSEAPLFDAALDLQDHFVGRGHPDANVTYRLEREPKLRVTFDIREGPRATVSRLQFDGNTALDDDQLFDLWTRTSSGGLGLGDPLFVLEDLESLRLSMLSAYDGEGYLDAAVDGPIVRRDPDKGPTEVAFTIVEGPQFHFAEVAIDSNLPVDAAALGVANMKSRVFDRSAVATLGARVRRELLKTGYPDPHVEIELTTDRQAHTVEVRILGTPGPRAKIASIAIVGNGQTADYVIDRHVAMKAGAYYDGDAVELTTSELYRTGLFRRVEIERTPTTADGDAVDMTVRVDEIDALELDLLAGWGSYETLRGSVLFTDRNLFGTGQRFSAGARASLKGEALTTSWQEPYLFGSKTSLTVGGYARRREEPSYEDTSRGVDTAFARDLFGPVRGRIGYSLQTRDGSDIDPSIATPDDSSYEIGSIFTELLIDRRDSPLYPSRGSRQSLKYERAGRFVGGTIDLDRVTWSSAWFVPISEPFVLGIAARGGAIWTPSGDPLPVQERFFNGGESSVRSFREAQLGPKSVTGTATGGSYFNTFNVELRFPILAAVHGAVFADAGNVGTDVDLFEVRKLSYGIGAGLRLVLPIGPLRVDYAHNPNPEPDDERWVVHFSVGLPF
ncbi:MAG: outer membrane protein assembly factor BamA [Planctomycetota bacterium]